MAPAVTDVSTSIETLVATSGRYCGEVAEPAVVWRRAVIAAPVGWQRRK